MLFTEKSVCISGPSPQQLIGLLADLSSKCEDITLDCESLAVDNEGNLNIRNNLFGEGQEMIPTTEHALGLLLSLLRIPKSYYDRCPPGLQARNFNHWMSRKCGKKLLVRMWSPEVGIRVARAFFTPRFQPGMDDIHVFPYILASLETMSRFPSKIRLFRKNSTITLLDVDLIDYRTEEVDRIPYILQGGVSVTNSEVGVSAVRIQPSISYRRAVDQTWHTLCDYTSGGSIRFRHIGKPRLEEIQAAVEIAMEAAATALPASLSAMVTPVLNQPYEELKGVVEDNISIPNTILLILEDDWKERQQAVKGEVVDAIINAVGKIPSFTDKLEKELEVKRACARYLGLFTSVEEKIGDIVAQAAQQVVAQDGWF